MIPPFFLRGHHCNASPNALVDIGYLNMSMPTHISGLILYLVFPEGGGRGIGWKNTLRCFKKPNVITKKVRTP